MKALNYIKALFGLRQLTGVSVGLIAGYAYWYFYGCTEGCTITGTALNSSLYFGMMGYFASGLIVAKKDSNLSPDRQNTTDKIEEKQQ